MYIEVGSNVEASGAGEVIAIASCPAIEALNVFGSLLWSEYTTLLSILSSCQLIQRLRLERYRRTGKRA